LNLLLLFKDNAGRYTYRNQPDICEWNCIKLAEVWDPHLPLAKSKDIVKKIFKKEFSKAYMEKMGKKVNAYLNNIHLNA
jgi:uncharacterized protein YdiU (UPF0061 family)